MTLPTEKSFDFEALKAKKYLRLQNTGVLFHMDSCDWEKAKHVLWWWKDDQPVTKQGMPFAEYVGIKAKRRTLDTDHLDFRRSTYA